ncbi:MAG: histidine kinase [Flavobacteriales bacterium]|nr:histidine kinase [Flavobacteriales bacterium]
MSPRRRYLLYWATQLGAWGGYVGLYALWTYVGGTFDPELNLILVLVFALGIATSHALREVMVRNHWLERPLGLLIPRLALTGLLLGLTATVMEGILVELLLPQYDSLFSSDAARFFEQLINWVVLLVVWSLAYLAYHYFARNRLEEIRNLRLQTADRENQLNNLRSQLNPHFMFNALNGIRALIDEDPAQAKRAITQLSAILRNAMSTVKRTTVPLGEEVDIVKAYLALEAMRFEERLRVQIDVPQGLEREPVPPMLLQTLVENAVRHGVAKLTQGGDIHIAAQQADDGLHLTVRNTGHYEPGRINGSGIGLRNTQRRLDLIYGRKANLHISNADGMVVTDVLIPRVEAKVVEDEG